MKYVPPHADLLLIKDWTARQVAACGSQEAAAAALGVSQERISDLCHPDKPNAVITLPQAMRLQAFSGEPVLAAALAERAGHLLVKLPAGTHRGPVWEALGKTGKEFGEVVERVTEALKDGRITPAEAAGMQKEVADLISVSVGLQLAIEQLDLDGEGA